MNAREQLLQEALKLSVADQQYLAQSLADHLIACIPQPVAEIEGTNPDEFCQELIRRSAAYQTGDAISRPAFEWLAEFRTRQQGERAN